MIQAFQDYAYYYNAFYKDKNYKAEAAQVHQLLQKYGQNVHSIINYGCGTGKHDVELSMLGYQCVGIDISSEMIEIAKKTALENNCNIIYSVADIRKYVPAHKYDAVISLFHVMSYQNANQDILDAFSSVRAALGSGGIFLFDVWYGPGVLTDPPIVRVKEVDDEAYKLVRVARPIMYDKKNIVDVCYEVLCINKREDTVKVINETHSMRYFFRPELEILLGMAGFELLDNIDCNSLTSTDYNSWTSYFIAKAV